MTTLLPPVEVGKITLIATGTAFFSLFLVNPVGVFITRRLHSWDAAGFFKYYFHLFCVYLMVIAILAAFLVWLLLQSYILELGISLIWCAILIASSLFFNTINQTLVPSMNLLDRPRPFVILTIGTLIFGLLTSVLLIKWFGATAVAWLTGLIFSQMVFSIIAYMVFFMGKPTTCRSLKNADYRRLFDFAWPISLAVGLNWLQMQGYRFVLADKFGLADLGLFAAGYGLASSLNTACDIVTTTWFQPRFYREINSINPLIRAHAWSNYASNMLPLSIMASSGIFMTAPYLTSIMLGPNYHAAAAYVIVGALAEWGRTIFNIFSLEAHGSLNTRRLIVPSFIGMITTFLIMLIPLSTKMLVAIPLAVLAGCLIMSVVVYVHSSEKGVLVTINWRKILLATVPTFIVCLVFGFCQQFLLPHFGVAEPYGALILALGLWGFIARNFLLQRMP
jgi:O-antigen/teichoic acid export membrane protein